MRVISARVNSLVSAAIDHADKQGVLVLFHTICRGTSSKLCPLQQDHFLPYFISSRRNVAEQLQVSRNNFRAPNDFSGEHARRLVLLLEGLVLECESGYMRLRVSDVVAAAQSEGSEMKLCMKCS